MTAATSRPVRRGVTFLAMAAVGFALVLLTNAFGPKIQPPPPPPQSTTKTPPPWLALRQGVRAFTGDDGGGATTLTVCPSVRFYNKWFSGATAAEMGCAQKPRGVPITIGSDEIVSYRFGEYFVFIKAASWSGWTGSFGIRPYIPANTKVIVHTAAPGGWTTLWPNRTSARGGIDLYSGATLLILSQDTKSENLPDLYAQITGDSPNAGKKGWITALGLDVQGGGPLFFIPPSGVEWR